MTDDGCFVVIIDFVNIHGKRIPTLVNEDDTPVTFTTREAAEEYAQDVPLCRMFSYWVLNLDDGEVV